ncbi:CotH kinase family protein [Runella sp.]|uniref:CotH kinase family protein n=1 Tax=Runella sp. TaxID=1960881 RepID=UPI003D0E7AB2
MNILKVLALFILLTIAFACKDKEIVATDDGSGAGLADWTTETHSKDGVPNYDIVFPQNQVNTLEIRMKTTDWSAIRTDMKALKGSDFGVAGGGAGGGVNTSDEPNYVAVSMKFNGKEWYKVGFRLKGNSSLSSIWRAGIYKLPFRLKMDEFEDQYPEINDQRFYGFKEFSLSPAFKDNSLIREKVTADIFRMAGIPAAQTSFYKIYIDFGDGLKYCGVYTLLETIEDEMLKSQFGEKKGNVYKPESTFQSFSQSQFEKKNNEDVADWSDAKAFITALNDPIRTTNASLWRENLEKIFNIDHFIKWLAVNTTMVNWDTYGAMAHNHYLYNHSAKKLTWIPWDNNEALTSNARVQLSLAGVAGSWPLIRYVADDAVYYAKYKTYVKEFNNTVFTTAKMNELFDKNTTLISPFVNGTEKEQTPYSNLANLSNFTSALPVLKQQVVSRNQAVTDFLK